MNLFRTILCRKVRELCSYLHFLCNCFLRVFFAHSPIKYNSFSFRNNQKSDGGCIGSVKQMWMLGCLPYVYFVGCNMPLYWCDTPKNSSFISYSVVILLECSRTEALLSDPVYSHTLDTSSILPIYIYIEL